MEGIDKNTFKQIFYDYWDAFKQFRPRFDSPDYNDTIQKMLDCGDPEKMGFVQYRCGHCGEIRRIAFTCKSCFCLSCAKVYTDRWADFIGRRLLPKGFHRIRYYGLHGNVRYQKMREQLADIIPAQMADDPRGYRVVPKKPFQQRFFDSFGKDPLLCPKCDNDMSLELIYHPKYGIIKEFLLFEELPDERQTVGTAAGRTIHRAERLVQVSLPFL